ncbi:MAG: hypothetical protein DWC04_03070 [Candidatus Poseidoniales archaeon]|nr:MAG: hypothetical protein DWC04_03070 [Candidatus Poseidoniales archaeon]
MEEVKTLATEPKKVRFSMDTAFLALGAIASILQPIILLLSGKDVTDAIWPHAYRALQATMFLRENITLLFFLGLMLFFTSFLAVNSILKGRPLNQNIRRFLLFILGLFSGLTALYFLLDIFYLRGAFLLLPTLYGMILLSTLLAVGGLPRLPDGASKGEFFSSGAHLCAIFFAAWLVMPGVPAMIGIAPSPPEAPRIGYGADPGPFDTTMSVHPYAMPELVADVILEEEQDIEFSVYLTLPQISQVIPLDEIPLALLSHGWGYPVYEEYTDWITHLSARGIAVAFVQYPSHIDPPIPAGLEGIDVEGASNYPHHEYRAMAIAAALDTVQDLALGDDRHPSVDAAIGNVTINPSHLWIGGHSLGGAYSFIQLYEAMERGWGNSTLFVDIESGWTRPNQASLQPNFSRMPADAMVHIARGVDDMTVDACYSVHHQQAFADLEDDHVLYIELQSDLYGFPRLVGSHYLPTDSVHDRLADYGVYRRIDAQADWVFARTQGDHITENWAYNHLVDSDLLRSMGEWSDGTPVLPLLVYKDALHTEKKFAYCETFEGVL